MATHPAHPASPSTRLTRRTLLRGVALAATVSAMRTLPALANDVAPVGAQPAPGTFLPAPEIVVADEWRVPAQVCVPLGATVTWVNEGAGWIRIAALDGTFDSGQVDPGDAFAHTFTRRGNVTYVCEHHPVRDMTGRITIR